eukprot:g32541.t1
MPIIQRRRCRIPGRSSHRQTVVAWQRDQACSRGGARATGVWSQGPGPPFSSGLTGLSRDEGANEPAESKTMVSACGSYDCS